ncbi:MAG: thioesterase [Desulfuromonas sp.]|nr:MAG: thioesterase [Desulfuromonas sp.]
MKVDTHHNISPHWVGEPIELTEGAATARLFANEQMAADEHGLVHGGFTFGLADYAAMLAVNDPNVVLGGAQCRFLAPVTVGEEMVARAVVEESQGKKQKVRCSVTTSKPVFEAEFTCFVLDRHILECQK